MEGIWTTATKKECILYDSTWVKSRDYNLVYKERVDLQLPERK